MGFPLTVGLPAKIFLVQATIEADYLWLGIVLVLLSALAAVFYLRVMFRMFMYEPRYALASPSQPLMVIGLVASVVGTVGLGVFFSPVWEYAQRAAGA
jgi:NADH-quinone oxidoreductase subunit N